jgi:hypothetical protein
MRIGFRYLFYYDKLSDINQIIFIANNTVIIYSVFKARYWKAKIKQFF